MGNKQAKALRRKVVVAPISEGTVNADQHTTEKLEVPTEEEVDSNAMVKAIAIHNNNISDMLSEANTDRAAHVLVDVDNTEKVEEDNSNVAEANEVPATMPGYRPPEPQLLTIDDIRSPIPWYQDDEEERDEFNWTQVEEDLLEFEDGKTIVSYPSSYATAGTAITPRSVLINSPLVSGPLISRPQMTPSGRRISFMNQEKTRRSLGRTSVLSVDAVSIHGMPRRNPPRKGSLNFSVIDEHARTARPEHVATFTALTEYLRKPIRYHPLTDLMMARGLIVWLAYQKTQSSVMVPSTITTPKGLLKLVANGKKSYSEAYCVLCREAGLPCVLINGIAKRTEMDMSDPSGQVVNDTWTAVYVEADWQLVHPYWICRGLDGLGGSLDDWIRREVETGGRKRAEVVKQLKEIVKVFINEDYFMPTPEVFVHSNWTDDNRWQLLRPEYTILTKSEFLFLPILFPAFFRFGLRLVSERCCSLESSEGKVKIWISADFNNAHRLTLSTELHLLSTECANHKLILPHLNKLVIHSRHNDYFYIEVRFPIEGTFRLEINGGYHGSHALRLCQFRIICNRRIDDFKYIPYEPFPLMWGPGPECLPFGLTLPSKPTGIVRIYQQIIPADPQNLHTLQRPPVYKPRQFHFHLHVEKSKLFDYVTELRGYLPDDNSGESTPLDSRGQLVDKSRVKTPKKGKIAPEDGDYSPYHECYKEPKKRQLVINVQVPHEGEFALVISALPYAIGDDGKTKVYSEPTVVCVYLLRTMGGLNRENGHQKLARAELLATMLGTNPTAVYNALDKCHRTKINKHDDELAAGKSRAEYLAMRKEIFDAIHRRNYRVCNETLVKLSKYKNKGALVLETRRLFALRNQLKKLLEFPKYIPELRHAGDDLLFVGDPPPEVHITMGALLLLLEEPDKAIESWDHIKKQISNEHVYKQMSLVAELFPSYNTRNKILTLLAEYNFDRVKRVSESAAKFYVWTQKVMGVLEDIDFTVDPAIDEEKLAQAAQRREIEENNVHLTVSKTQLKPKKVTILDEEAGEYGARVMSIDMASDMAAADAQRQDIVTEQL